MKIHTIDLQFMGEAELIAAYLVEGETGLALVETGPASTGEALREGIEALGFSTEEVRDVLVTHIHLDHSGGAGWWAQRGARVHVHPRGARHLIDPAKLLAGASEIYGDRMGELWGETLPCPEDRVISVEDGGSVVVGDLVFTAWDTPGHARHHHAWVIGEVAFVGDVAGVRFLGSSFTGLAAAPPQFDPVAYEGSIDRLAAGGFERIYPTHFGVVEDVEEHLAAYRELVAGASGAVRGAVAAEASRDEIISVYGACLEARAKEAGCSAEEWSLHELCNPVAMSADGVALYWRQRDAE
jgi:glyoxylase-like metal-dependent hydrolase (beta-lactamase superfamily II)